MLLIRIQNLNKPKVLVHNHRKKIYSESLFISFDLLKRPILFSPLDHLVTL